MKTSVVQVGKLLIGGDHPIVVQSMTNTETSDVESTVQQVKELSDAGAEIVRITVNTLQAAKAVSKIRKLLDAEGYQDCALVGDFHFNGHLLLKECILFLQKARINPGTSITQAYFDEFIRIALDAKKPVRIGVNKGSLERGKTMVESAIQAASRAQALGLAKDQIILSIKSSDVRETIASYRALSQLGYSLHLGLTEAGSSMKGLISSTAALSVLLSEGIGNTIRYSLTPRPRGKRTDEVEAAKILLQSLGLRKFQPEVISCPGCGRAGNDFYQELAQDVESFLAEKKTEWIKKYPGIKSMKVAVMGCVVNGPGEAQSADIGISLPGSSEQLVAQVFKKGKRVQQLKGQNISQEFKQLIEAYVKETYSV